jgi:hypothetical protein
MKLITLSIILVLVLPPTIAVFATNPGYLSNDMAEQEEVIYDSKPPRSTLEAVPNIIFWPENIYSRPTALIKWGGIDRPIGADIQNFDVQYKMQYIGPGYHTMELPEWQDWLNGTENTSATMSLKLDYVYYFRCRARDYYNNVESWPVTWDAAIIAIGVAPQSYDDIEEILRERKEEREDDEDNEDRIRPHPEPRDEIPPESTVKKLFPFHIMISPLFFIQYNDQVSVMIYPYPPVYYMLSWLEEQGIISQCYDYGTIPISWFGEDNPGGTGIESYDVQYRNPHIRYTLKDEPGKLPIARDWRNIINYTWETETKFKVYGAGYYQFRCRARDAAGNEDEYSVKADTSVLVIDLRNYYC